MIPGLIHKTLIAAGFKDWGYCACAARIRTYKKGRFKIKVYGKGFLRLLEKEKLIINGGTIEELIQKTVQELASTG